MNATLDQIASDTYEVYTLRGDWYVGVIIVEADGFWAAYGDDAEADGFESSDEAVNWLLSR